MKCPKCKAEFTPPAGTSLANCPLCEEVLLRPADLQRCETMPEALESLSVTYGREILLNQQRLRAFLQDLLPGGKLERVILNNIFSAGIAGKIDAACGKSPQEQQQLAVRFTNQLREDYGTAEEAGADVLWVYAEALGWEKRPEPVPEATPAPVPAVIPAAPPTAANDVAPAVDARLREWVAGKVINFGGKKWRILEIQQGKALILSEYVIGKREYHDREIDVTWETSLLRGYLNREFYNTFGQSDRDRMIETQIHNPDNLWYGTKGGRDTLDKIFLLSIEEADKYFGNSGDYVYKRRLRYVSGNLTLTDDGFFIRNHDTNSRATTMKGSMMSEGWWLRTPGTTNTFAGYVEGNGDLSVFGASFNENDSPRIAGLRPALWLDISRLPHDPSPPLPPPSAVPRPIPAPITSTQQAAPTIQPSSDIGNAALEAARRAQSEARGQTPPPDPIPVQQTGYVFAK